MESFFIIILAVLAVLVVSFVFVLWRHKKAGMKEVKLVGQTGTADTDINPTGSVVVDGELWPARSRDGIKIPTSTRIRVVGVEGHLALVEPGD